MQIDVFTLFPHWFDWFSEQRHVRNSRARIETVDFRAGTPLSGGQVDDTPYGGGAGVVIRVDGIEAALQARYGEGAPPGGRGALCPPRGPFLAPPGRGGGAGGGG